MNNEINNKIITYLSQYNPVKIGIFGSYARNEDTAESDIDILVDFKKTLSLFDLGGIKYDLIEILKRPEDIVTEKSLNKRLKKYILNDLKIIYG